MCVCVCVCVRACVRARARACMCVWNLANEMHGLRFPHDHIRCLRKVNCSPHREVVYADFTRRFDVIAPYTGWPKNKPLPNNQQQPFDMNVK